MAERGLQAAVQLLLRALSEEDEARKNCESKEGAMLFLELGAVDRATELRKGCERAVHTQLGAAIVQATDRELSTPVQLLLEALVAEDEARKNCNGFEGVAYFLALGSRNDAVEMRQGYARLVSRLLGKVPVQDGVCGKAVPATELQGASKCL